MSDRLSGSCHCGAVRLTIPAAIEDRTRCNCTLCTKLGTTWVYFPRNAVTIEGGPLAEYVRDDLSKAYLRTVRCAHCGCVTHWQLLEAATGDRMGVNANLFEPEALADIELRLCDGRSWEC